MQTIDQKDQVFSKRLAGHVAIITGGGHGIGKAYAKYLALEGAKVVIAELDANAAESAANELNDQNLTALGIPTDVSSINSLQNMVEQVMQNYGRIDILVNNAAIFSTIPISRSPFDQVDPEEWDKVMEVNLKGTWLACRAVVPVLKKQGGGKIININYRIYENFGKRTW